MVKPINADEPIITPALWTGGILVLATAFLTPVVTPAIVAPKPILLTITCNPWLITLPAYLSTIK